MVIELESVKTLISAPAHPSAAGIGRVSGLVTMKLTKFVNQLSTRVELIGRVNIRGRSSFGAKQRGTLLVNCWIASRQVEKTVYERYMN